MDLYLGLMKASSWSHLTMKCWSLQVEMKIDHTQARYERKLEISDVSFDGSINGKLEGVLLGVSVW